MPIQPCPSCKNQTPRWLEASSKDAYVNYYRCDVCGHIWTLSKDDPTVVKHITPLPKK